MEQQLSQLYKHCILRQNSTTNFPLSSLCSFQEGYVNPSQKNPEYFGGTIKWIRALDINDIFIFNTSRHITERGFASAKQSATLFYPDSIVVSKSGTIGRIGILTDYMCGNRAIINIRPIDKNYLPIIYNFLKSKQDILPDLAVGSVQKNLYISLIKDMSIPLPKKSMINNFNYKANIILNKMKCKMFENNKLIEIRDYLLPKLMSGALDVSDIAI